MSGISPEPGWTLRLKAGDKVAMPAQGHCLYLAAPFNVYTVEKVTDRRIHTPHPTSPVSSWQFVRGPGEKEGQGREGTILPFEGEVERRMELFDEMKRVQSLFEYLTSIARSERRVMDHWDLNALRALRIDLERSRRRFEAILAVEEGSEGDD